MDFVVAAAPIVLLIVVMTMPRGLPSYIALPLMALLLYGCKLAYFGNSPRLVHATVIFGLLEALIPISIVFGAILLFRTMERSGSMDTIRVWLNSLTANPAGQVMVVGWAFVFLIEGASGFGTPAALAAPLLVGMGFQPLRVAVLCLVMDSVPVTFGAVGTPVWFGLGDVVSESSARAELLAVSWRAAVLNATAALVVPVLALRVVLPWSVIRRNLVFIYLSILACVVPHVLIAVVNYEFPALGGGFIGLMITAALARSGIGMDSTPAPFAASGADTRGPEALDHASNSTDNAAAHNGAGEASMDDAAEPPGVSRSRSAGAPMAGDASGTSAARASAARGAHRHALAAPGGGSVELPAGGAVSVPADPVRPGMLVKAMFPLWGTLLLLIVTRVQQLGLRDLLKTTEPSWTMELGALFTFKISPALVIQTLGILGEDGVNTLNAVSWKYEALYIPALIPFVIVACATWVLFGMSLRACRECVTTSARQMLNPILALLGALVLVKLLMMEEVLGGGEIIPAAAQIIGLSVAALLGPLWQYFAVFLGALGAFFSGSATVSNMTFGGVQANIAAGTGLSTPGILAQQSAGAAMGNMVCIHNIVAVCSILGLEKAEGRILLRTALPMAVYGVIVAVAGLLLM